MQRLRFRGVEQGSDPTTNHVLSFPGGVRDVLSRPDPTHMTPDELATSMEATLQRMEASLDLLRRDSGAFHMPGFGRDDDPPRAA